MHTATDVCDATFALFDDNLGNGPDLWLDEALAGLACHDAAALPAFFAHLTAAAARGHWVALAARYELGHALHPAGLMPAPSRQPLIEAWIFARGTWQSAEQTDARLNRHLQARAADLQACGIAGWQQSLDWPTYHARLARIHALIRAGECYQINLTYPLTGQLYGDPLALYCRLRQQQPVAYGAYLEHPGGQILSRSPELFVERHGHTLTCRPMKGTAAPDAPDEALSASEKNRAENLMIVDLIRNDLGRLAQPGAVSVPALFTVEPYRSLKQMTSTVRAEGVEADLFTIFAALFPCGSVTGAPKLRAMHHIQTLESGPRGLYCGALGWLAPSGDFRFNVPIRTLCCDPTGQVRLDVGSGIVSDADPAEEWAECRLKARFATALRPDFQLVETLRCEAGAAVAYPRLAGHLERLTRSAAWFGFALDLPAIRKALADLAQALAATRPGLHRVRLTLAADGCHTLTHAPLAPEPDARQSICLATERLQSGNPLLRHKITARPVHDRALAMALAGGHFDALLLNEAGQLCEGARSNLFVARAGQLLTPPLACGVLPGVLRAGLLAEGRAREAVLTLADLDDADALYLGNALRGLVEIGPPDPGV